MEAVVEGSHEVGLKTYSAAIFALDGEVEWVKEVKELDLCEEAGKLAERLLKEEIQGFYVTERLAETKIDN